MLNKKNFTYFWIELLTVWRMYFLMSLMLTVSVYEMLAHIFTEQDSLTRILFLNHFVTASAEKMNMIGGHNAGLLTINKKLNIPYYNDKDIHISTKTRTRYI